MTYRMHIPPAKVADVRTWFRERGGVLLWHDREITSSPSPDLMTPATHADGSPATPPHWKYGDAEPLRPDEIAVRTEERFEPPLDWFPACAHCQDLPGRRRLAELLDPGELFADCRARLLQINHDRLEHIDLRDDDTLRCWACDGTGHTDRHVRVRVKHHYWGYDVSDKGRARAEKKVAELRERLGRPDLKWDWEHVGDGLAELVFYAERIEPFVLEEVPAGA